MTKPKKNPITKLDSSPMAKSEPRTPTDAEALAAAQAKRRVEDRPSRVQIEAKVDGNHIGLNPAHSSGGPFQIHDAMGTTSFAFAEYVLAALTNVSKGRDQGEISDREMNAALALLDGQKPEDEMQAMLVAQTFACFDLGMNMAARANRTDRHELRDSYASISTKMMRTMTATVETLSKLRRGGAQTVRVEHVHVHNGGQAIVGNVSTGGGGNGRIDIQSQALGRSEQNSAVALALSGADAFGQTMPIPINAKRPLPNARRNKSGTASG